MPFVYQNPDNSRAVGSISELMARRGDIAAQRDLAQGQIASQEAQGLGQVASTVGQQIPAAIAAAKTREIITKTPKIDLGGGVQGYDVGAISDAVTKAGGDPSAALPHLMAINQSFQQVQAARIAANQTGARAVIAGGNDPVLAKNFLDAIEKNGIYPPATVQQWRDMIDADPGNVAKITAYLAGPQKMETAAPGSSARNPNTGEIVPNSTAPPLPGTGQHVVNGQVVDDKGNPVGNQIPKESDPAAEARATETARHNQEIERIAGLNAGREAARDAEVKRHDLATEAQGDAAPLLTPEALHLTAHQFAMTGNLPPMGMGKQGAKARADIINAAADEYKNLDLPSQVAAYKANQDSLKKLQGQRDAISSFEATAGKNIDIFLDSAGKVVDTGSPLANSLARQVSGKMLGSSDQAAYDAARQVAVNEIAKITSNPSLSGSLSDSARHEIDAFNPQSATLAQSVKVMRVLKQDMANRASSMDDTIKAVQQRIATVPGSSPAPPPAPSMIEAKDAQGNIHHAPAGTPLPAGWTLVKQ